MLDAKGFPPNTTQKKKGFPVTYKTRLLSYCVDVIKCVSDVKLLGAIRHLVAPMQRSPNLIIQFDWTFTQNKATLHAFNE